MSMSTSTLARAPAAVAAAGFVPSAAKKGVPSASMPLSAPIYGSAGEIVGRRDLSDETILAAVAERLAFEQRDPRQARVVLDAALHGKRIAVNFVRSLALPMPQAALAMPIQPLLAEKPAAPAGGRRRFFFFG